MPFQRNIKLLGLVLYNNLFLVISHTFVHRRRILFAKRVVRRVVCTVACMCVKYGANAYSSARIFRALCEFIFVCSSTLMRTLQNSIVYFTCIQNLIRTSESLCGDLLENKKEREKNVYYNANRCVRYPKNRSWNHSNVPKIIECKFVGSDAIFFVSAIIIKHNRTIACRILHSVRFTLFD